MSKYYISSSIGNDNNTGTVKYPWKSLAKINSLKNDDIVYLKRGDTFYGTIITPSSISNNSLVTISAYGIGNKPVVSTYMILNKINAWTQESANIWKIDLTTQDNYIGYTESTDVNIGFIKVDNIIKGGKKSSKTDLKTQWDFYSDGTQYLYVYSTSNPTSLVKELKVAPNTTLVETNDNCKIINIEFCGSGGTGFFGTCTNVYVGNCTIHEIGGSYLSSTLRYGNGFTFWNNSKDCIVENNEVYDIYDVAFSPQGIGTFENIEFRNNTDWNCEQSFELWSQGTTSGTGFINCSFKNNISINAGYSWGHDYRTGWDSIKAASLYLQMMEAPLNDIEICGNVFYNPRQGLLCSNSIVNGDTPQGFNSHNNYVFLAKDCLINNFKTYKIQDYNSYITDTGLEKGTLFFTLNEPSNDISDIIGNIITQIGQDTTHIKVLQNKINTLSGKIEDLTPITNSIQQIPLGTELKHMNGFVRPSGGYTTNVILNEGNYYAPLFKFSTSFGYGRFDMALHYSVCASSDENRRGVGMLNMQIVGDNLTDPKVYMDVFEFLEFNYLSASDFIAVIEETGDILTEKPAIIGLYFKVGSHEYTELNYQPVLLCSDDMTGATTYQFYDKATIITVLPSGTQIKPSNVPLTYNKLPKTGTSAPTTTPTYIGQEYIDTTNKKIYKAIGTTSNGDWVVIN